MRIGIYDPYLDDLGGGEKYMMTIAECLSKNHQVDVFWDDKNDLDKLQERFAIDFSKIKLTRNIFSSNVGTLERMGETRKYDVLIILSDGSVPLTLSKKLILHMQQPLNPALAKDIKTKLKFTRVNTIFYNSQFSSKFNSKIFQKVKSKVIYPPVSIHFEKTKKENIILHVGRFRVTNAKISDYKKQQTMVDAFKKMVDDGLKGWKFIVATSILNEKDTAFQQMLHSAKNYPVEFLVNKSNKELWQIYNKAKIYWHASGYGEDLEVHPELAEHFGISTVEAMGAGVVPVVFNAGGQREIVIDGMNGYLWNTLEELSEKTKKIMNDTQLWGKFSEEDKKDAQRFSKNTFFDAVNRLVTQ